MQICIKMKLPCMKKSVHTVERVERKEKEEFCTKSKEILNKTKRKF